MIRAIFQIGLRDMRNYARRPMLLFCLIVAPLLTIVFFTTLMWSGLPTKLPAAIVDEDDTQVTRTFIRTIDALQQTDIVARYHTFGEAREAMLRGEIYAIFHIPRGTSEKAVASRQPQITFYTNDAYILPAALLFKDLRMASELMGIAITRETLYGHGLTNDQAMAIVQPIVIEKHALGNPWLNYSIYLCSIILPGILMILVMLLTAYMIGQEWKEGTQHSLYQLAGESQTVALVGKLWPILFIFSLWMVVIDLYLYAYLQFPCFCPLWQMVVFGVLLVMASQGLAVFVFGIFAGQMRFAMSVCSLWGIVSISMSGFTFPVSAMHPVLQWACHLFPMRHYYLIYVNAALNGYSPLYAAQAIVSLLVFMLLPMLVLKRYQSIFLKSKYIM